MRATSHDIFHNLALALQSSILNFVRTSWSVCPVILASPLVFKFLALLSERKEPAELCAGFVAAALCSHGDRATA